MNSMSIIRGRGRARAIEKKSIAPVTPTSSPPPLPQRFSLPQTPTSSESSASSTTTKVSPFAQKLPGTPISVNDGSAIGKNDIPAISKKKSFRENPYKFNIKNQLPFNAKQATQIDYDSDDSCAVCDRPDKMVLCKTCGHAWKVIKIMT
jgi:hypothetical protein